MIKYLLKNLRNYKLTLNDYFPSWSSYIRAYIHNTHTLRKRRLNWSSNWEIFLHVNCDWSLNQENALICEKNANMKKWKSTKFFKNVSSCFMLRLCVTELLKERLELWKLKCQVVSSALTNYWHNKLCLNILSVSFNTTQSSSVSFLIKHY